MFGLGPAEIGRVAPFARDGGAGSPMDWAAAGERLDDEQIVALIRLFTRAEMAFPAWKGGDRSPVIALAALLKRPRRLSRRADGLDQDHIPTTVPAVWQPVEPALSVRPDRHRRR